MKNPPTFVCGACKQTLSKTQINGKWYAVNGDHFSTLGELQRAEDAKNKDHDAKKSR